MIKRRLLPLGGLLILFLFTGLSTAHGRTMEAGTFWVNGGMGPGLKLGERMGGSDGFFMVNGGVEYTLTPRLSLVGDVDWGLASTVPFRLHVGARHRWTGWGGPFSPFAQVQLTAGTVFNTLGADLGLMGIRLSGGLDYFVTSRLAGGICAHWDGNATLSPTPAFYGVMEVLATVSYSF